MGKLKENENIDFGQWFCPTDWSQVSLKMFQEISRYYEDESKKFDVREVLHILTERSIEDISQLPIDFVDKLLNSMIWLHSKPTWDKATNKVKIDGEEYIVNIKDKLKTGEFIAVDSVLKSDSHNYAAILAILCRKEGEIFDSRFENEVLESRVRMFEGISVVKVMPIVNFFLQCFMVFHQISQVSSMVEEAISLERENIQNLRKNGELSILSTKCAMRKLRKLERSMKRI